MSKFQEYLEAPSGKLSEGKDFVYWRDFISKCKTQGFEYALMNYPYKGKDQKMLQMQEQFRELYEKLDEYIDLNSEKYNLGYK